MPHHYDRRQRYSRPVGDIIVRDVADEAQRRYYRVDQRGRGYYPKCRGKKHGPGWILPAWNVRWEYAFGPSGRYVSLYWCNKCLPENYRLAVADMRRHGCSYRRYQGDARQQFGVGEDGYRRPVKKRATAPSPQPEVPKKGTGEGGREA